MVQIRDELPSDAGAIDAVTVAAFRHAAHASHTEQFIVRALRNSEQLVVALVAEEGGVVIGFAASALVFPGVPPRYFQAVSFNGHIPSGAVEYHASFEATA